MRQNQVKRHLICWLFIDPTSHVIRVVQRPDIILCSEFTRCSQLESSNAGWVSASLRHLKSRLNRTDLTITQDQVCVDLLALSKTKSNVFYDPLFKNIINWKSLMLCLWLFKGWFIGVVFLRKHKKIIGMVFRRKCLFLIAFCVTCFAHLAFSNIFRQGFVCTKCLSLFFVILNARNKGKITSECFW